MKNILIIVFVCLSAGSLFAQEEIISLTLEEAQEYALENNKTLINAHKDIQLASEQIKEAKGSGLPQANASLDYMTNFNYEMALDFGSGTSTDYSQYLENPLFDQGDIAVFGSVMQVLGSSSSSNIVMKDQANANIQVTQLIFSGQYWVGIQMAKLAKEIAEKNLLTTEISVKETVGNLYYGILASQEYIKILEHMLVNNKDILKRTTDMYKKGLAEEIDVDQFKMVISQLENSKKSIERSLEYSYNTFRFVLGIESGKEIILKDNLDKFIGYVNEDQLIKTNLDLNNNPTYQLVETQEEISKKNITMQKWAYGPTISGYYSYTEKLLTTTFDLSPKNAAGLTLSLPIISGGTKRAQLNQAKIELDKASRSKYLLEEQLTLEDKQLTFEVKNAHDNYITQKENVEVAKRVYENINNKYNQGLVSSLDLTQANNNYLQAENNYISAVINLLQSKLKLDKLHNNL